MPPAELLVPASRGTSLGIVIQELMGNSIKHGALGTRGGRVELEWEPDPAAGDGRCRLRWRESGGPPIAGDPGSGLGSELITGLVRSDLRGDVELGYRPGGVDHRFTINLAPAAGGRPSERAAVPA